jgi:predicted enzyme related to lactoylglutathione lyase
MKLRAMFYSLILLTSFASAEVMAYQKKVPAKTGKQPSEGKAKPTFLGLRTVVYRVTNLKEAKTWYSRALGVEPYFDRDFYVGFNVGGYELGLEPDDSEIENKPGGVAAYWGVEDIEASLKRLLELGATKLSGVQDVGGGIRVATVVDPFGNIFSVIENPHFKAVDK